MKKSTGNILAVYAFILSIIVSITYIIMFVHIQEFNPKFEVLYIISSVLTIITSIISIVGLICANKDYKLYSTLSLIMNIICIIGIVYIYNNAADFV